ncbi:MAG: shikimate kinase [Treponema sp.]|jgi:shikimate kinase|nr:shikimate kinase [Treponema sp.]
MGISPFIWNIILLGPKHSGKTSTGRELAKLLGGPFIDLDELIEAQTGKSPRALFKESPGVFQAAELRALESLFVLRAVEGLAEGADSGVPQVIATGGGIIDNAGARRLLLAEDGGFLVNLEVSAETAWERVSLEAVRSGELPPFLDAENPREIHHLLHERRAAAYREIARLTVSGEGRTPGEAGQEIFKALGFFPG